MTRTHLLCAVACAALAFFGCAGAPAKEDFTIVVSDDYGVA